MKIKRSVIVGLTLALAGCGGELGKTEGLEPTGSDFSKDLYTGYVDLSRSEYNEGDYRDSDRFAIRARSAAGGELVEPEKISARKLPGDKVDELTSARARLVAALDQGAEEKFPELASRAQVSFDCWMQEQEENRQPDDIAACQSGFTTAVAELEEAMKPPPAPVVEAQPEPKPMQTLEPREFVLYFDFNEAELTADASAKLAEALDYAGSVDLAKFDVAGYTDTVGTADYNDTLAQLRAITVAAALSKAGISSADMEVASYGQNDLAVPTGDGVPEPLNRRVVLIVSK
ncbi:MAG: OmpA family protein [Alphaproteobacteria bacterium]